MCVHVSVIMGLCCLEIEVPEMFVNLEAIVA